MSGNSQTNAATPTESASPPTGELDAVADLFRTLGMARRLRITQLFVRVAGTLCGCEIADILQLEDYQVSRDLSALKKAGVVESRERTGTWIHYRLVTEPSQTVASLIELVSQLPSEPRVERRLAMRLAFRERAGCVLGVGDPEVLAALDRATDTQVLTVLD